ncbi:septum formation family protein [Nocardiopsis sp. FIRDI 009]|uniref:septum formation family protein n=1 Tax=Nocardiopsis sp. FIRDI 009 TaxID=714197 RepID=UPI001E460147|nr:septum formation family protein [Nocardiopsis sp. FIRDI 009]
MTVESDACRSILGRTALGLLAVGVALALSACGPVPLLPPALSAGETDEPEPVDPPEPTGPEPRPTSEPTHTPEPPEPSGPESVSVFDLEEGDCITDYTIAGDESISEVPVVDCAEPHIYEIYYAGDLDGDEYPGEEEVVEMTSERCEEEFAEFVGVPSERSELDHSWLFPTEDGWNGDDDREILCLVHERGDGQVSGSLEGAHR